MNSKKYPNLKPWQPGQSGNPAGRKPGSKNMATIVRELLDQEANDDLLAKSSVADQTKDTSTTYAKAIVQVVIQKALKGDMRAIIWLSEQQERNAVEQNTERVAPIVVSHLRPRTGN